MARLTLMSILGLILSVSLVLGQTPCSRNYTANDLITDIVSPNYPTNYPPRSRCYYTIFLEDPNSLFEISLIVNNFRTYLLSSLRDALVINSRSYFGDGSTQPTALQIGQTYSFYNRGSMTLYFNAYSGRTAQGFSLTYLVSPSDDTSGLTEACEGVTCLNGGTCHSHGPGRFKCYCQSGYTGVRCENVPNTHDCPKFYNLDNSDIGEITSTYYPSRYPYSHYCDMYITNATVGEKIAIYVFDFQTEQRYDILCIGSDRNCYSGDGRFSSGAMRPGQTYFYDIEETAFRLNFRTDRSRSYRGFRLSYSMFAGGDMLNVTTPGKTNKGTEFTFAFLPQRSNSTAGNTRLSITSEFTSSVEVVTAYNSQRANYTVSPLTPVMIELDNRMRTRGGLENKGVTVTSERNITVAAYSSTGSSSDGMLILPEANLGTQYVIPSYQPYRGSYSIVTVVGNTNDTIVWFVSRNESVDDDGGYDYDNALRVQVRDRQTYTLLSTNDLTGMKIVSDTPISVISGSDYAQVPADLGYGDHLTEMIPPTNALGYNFIVAPIAERRAGEVIRVVSWTDYTRVTLSDFSVTLHEGTFTEVEVSTTTSATTISCSKKCLVVQYNKGGLADDRITDPFMQIIPPINQFTQNHIFEVPQGYRAYVNIVINTTWIDGLELSGNNISEMATWIKVDDTDYSMSQVMLQDQNEYTLSHRLGDYVEWSAVLYGHSSSRVNRRGFGYPLGMQLDTLEPLVTEPPKVTDPPITAPPGNITERCRCNVRVIGNETAGEPEFGTLVHDVADILYFYPYEDCNACLDTLANCPNDCREEILDEWGSLGLASEIIIDTPRGPRPKSLGQLMCERHYVRIPPPGRKLAVHYRAGNCMPSDMDAPLMVGRITAGPYLCCAEIDVPVVGAVPAWDRNCDGAAGFIKSKPMVESIIDRLKQHGLDNNQIEDIIKNIK